MKHRLFEMLIVMGAYFFLVGWTPNMTPDLETLEASEHCMLTEALDVGMDGSIEEIQAYTYNISGLIGTEEGYENGELTERVIYHWEDGKLMSEDEVTIDYGEIICTYTYFYDGDGKLEHIEGSNPYGSIFTLITYTYDISGKLIREEEDYGNNGISDEVKLYFFDSNGRVIREEITNTWDPDETQTIHYYYDDEGKIIRFEEDFGSDGDIDCVSTLTHDTSGRYITEEIDTNEMDGNLDGQIDEVRTATYADLDNEFKYSDYFTPGGVGDAWSYVDLQDSTFTWVLEEITTGDNAGRMKLGDDTSGYIYDVTESFVTLYEVPGVVLDPPVLIPELNNTNMVIDLGDKSVVIYLAEPDITVPAGTFNDVLVEVWLDPDEDPNSMNTSLGLDGLTSYAVTDVCWFVKGVGLVKFYGVEATTGENDGSGYELTDYSPAPPVNPCECDLNHDGSCNVFDWFIFIEDWGRTDCSGDCECDLNNDGSCNVFDWFMFIEDWGRTDCPIP